MASAYGLDFGTSNSSIATADAGRTHVLPVDAGAANPQVVSSVLYVDRQGGVSIGAEAVRDFVEQNRNREIKKRTIASGRTVETELGEEMLRIEADVDLPGRFFQSTKSFLKDESFEGTQVFDSFMTIEELVSKFLVTLKARADALGGRPLRSVLMGRPVFFSRDAGKDRLAEQRLRDAARIAGFKHVEFLFEPIGAALAYEATIQREELAFVFDFGGGTLDFTVARIGPGRAGRADRSGDILAVGGVVIGGTTFDEEVMKKRLMKYFGAGYESKAGGGKSLGMPAWILAELQSWYRIPLLNERRTLRVIDELIRSASQGRDELIALLSLVRGNYGWELFQEVEQAKIALTGRSKARIVFERDRIDVREDITRREFESIISTQLRRVGEEIDQTIASAGLTPADIDVVIRTGGSSLIPAVQRLLVGRFGEEKIVQQEVFTSVVAGLALAADLRFR